MREMVPVGCREQGAEQEARGTAGRRGTPVSAWGQCRCHVGARAPGVQQCGVGTGAWLRHGAGAKGHLSHPWGGSGLAGWCHPQGSRHRAGPGAALWGTGAHTSHGRRGRWSWRWLSSPPGSAPRRLISAAQPADLTLNPSACHRLCSPGAGAGARPVSEGPVPAPRAAPCPASCTCWAVPRRATRCAPCRAVPYCAIARSKRPEVLSCATF